MSKKQTEILAKRAELEASLFKKGMREGIEIEKGAIITEAFAAKNFDLFSKYASFFSAYPDLFLDLITSEDSNFSLFFYQRIALRALMRYTEVYITAPRAWSKSYLTILAILLQCIFIPGTKRFICAPVKSQAAQIAKEKLTEIFDTFPLLRKEIIGNELKEVPGNYNKDSVKLSFRNGSLLDVVGALDSARGGRRHGGLVDEMRDHDEIMLNEVIIPLMSVSRRLPDNAVNPREPHAQEIYMTSAGTKNSYAFTKMVDVFQNSIIFPSSSFTMGCDYRVPLLHNLLNKDFISKLQSSPSYSIESFSTEYLSIWSGGSDESWFNFDKLQKRRKLKNPEMRANFRAGATQFYLLSVDVGRIHDQTVVCVFRVNITADTKYYITLVNLFVLGRTPETKPFHIQVADLKKIIDAFQPQEVVIDTMGLGVGFGDEMVRTQVGRDGIIYPAYGFTNDPYFKQTQPKDAIPILYSLKASASLNSQIHGNVYSQLQAGRVRFLIREQEAKSILLSTKRGQKMSPEERVKRLMPHEMTTQLFHEMSNLRLKRTGAGLDISLERINPRFPKDKYSAFGYGLWRIKEIEEAHNKRQKRNTGDLHRYTFYTEGA
ncbi:MAG TPA: hypothetical protein VFD28_03785 [Candidatus Eisenbacteria bacterium]|nr:hypothetical protein [Candidatus Eisenbacteria bacterium]